MKKKHLKFLLPFGVIVSSVAIAAPFFDIKTSANSQSSLESSNNSLLAAQPKGKYSLEQCWASQIKGLPSNYKNPLVWLNQSALNKLQLFPNNQTLEPSQVTAQHIASKIWENRATCIGHTDSFGGIYGTVWANPMDFLNAGDINVWDVKCDPNNGTVSYKCGLNRIPFSWEPRGNRIGFVYANDSWVLNNSGSLNNVSSTVSGVEFVNDSPKYSTQVISPATINWPNTLAQSIAKPLHVNELKQALIDNNFIANPTSKQPITINDFDIEPFVPGVTGWDCDNSKGEFYGNIVFAAGKYFNTNKPNTAEKKIPITINGFMLLKQTTEKTTPIKDDLHPNRYASSVSLKEINDFIKSKSADTFVNNPIILNSDQKQANPWVKDTTIEAINTTYNDKLGQITVEANMHSYSDNWHVVDDQPMTINFILNGYYNINDNPEMFSTKCPTSITINQANTLSQDYFNNFNNYVDINNAIKKEFASQITGYNQAIKTPSLIDSLNITKVIGYNNMLGEVNLAIEINNNYFLDVGNPVQTKTVEVIVKGFKKVQTTSVVSQFKLANRSKIFAKQYTQQLAEQDLETYKNQIITSLPPNASASIKYDGISYDNINGTVTVQITVSEYYDIDSQCTYVKKPKTFTCKFTGFISKNNNVEQFTTIVKSTQLKNIDDLYVYDLIDENTKMINNQKNLQRVLSAIVNSQAISWPANNQIITEQDIEIIEPIATFNNQLGQITCKIKIKNNKAWVNGIIKEPFISEQVSFTGFKPQPPTIVASNNLNVSNYLDWSNKLLVQISNQDLETYMHTKINDIYNFLPPNTNLIIKNIDRSNEANGIVNITVNINQSFSKTESKIISGSELGDQVISVSGFKSGINETTTFIGSINVDLTKYYYSDALDPIKEKEMNKIIIDELVKNQNSYFSKLVPGETLTANDIVVEINKDPKVVNNTIGVLYLKSITVLNNKAMNNGTLQASLKVNTTDINVSKLNVQNPTYWTKQVPVALTNGENYYPQAALANNNKILNDLIQANHNSIIFNSVSSVPIKIIKAEMNSTNDGIIASISVDKYYNEKGVLTNQLMQTTIEFKGFKAWNETLNTTWKLKSVKWSDSIFKSFFGTNNQGFESDWIEANIINDYLLNFTNYVNNLSETSVQKQELFNNSTNTKIANVTFNPLPNQTYQIAFDYNGILNGIEVNNLHTSFNLELRKEQSLVYESGKTAWEQWVKWVCLACGIGLAISIFIAIVFYVVRKQKHHTFINF